MILFFFFQITLSMKDQSLASIDEKVVNTGNFLEEIINSQVRNECLEAFRDCQAIILWLKDFTKSKLH